MADMAYRKSGRELERMNSSKNGNPRFRVTFDDGTSFPTEVDGQVGYCIGNPEFAGDVEITVRRGIIVDIRAVETRPACERCGSPVGDGGDLDFPLCAQCVDNNSGRVNL